MTPDEQRAAVRSRAADMRLGAQYADRYGDHRREMDAADAYEQRELARIDAEAPARPDAADMALVGLDLPTQP